MDSKQARAARAVLKMGVREIAELAGVTPNTISRIENGGDAKVSTMKALREVYETMGIVFVDAGREIPGPGVAWKE